MTDLVFELRRLHGHDPVSWYGQLAGQAANEIDNLRAQLAVSPGKSKITRAVLSHLARTDEMTTKEIKARVLADLPYETPIRVTGTMSMLTRDKRVIRTGFGRYKLNREALR